MRTCIGILGSFLLAGCGFIPYDEQFYQSDWRARVSVHGAPQGSWIYVNGLKMGESDEFNGNPGMMRLDPGIHQIRVVKGTEVIFDREICLGNTPKKIFVP